MSEDSDSINLTGMDTSNLPIDDDRHALGEIDLSPIFANSDDNDDDVSPEMSPSHSEMMSSAYDPLNGNEEAGLATPSNVVPQNSRDSPGDMGIRNKENSSNMQKNLEQLQDFEEKQPYEIQTLTRLKVKIKRLNVIGQWKWVDGNEDNCGICRTSFETACVDCKFPGDECPLVLGQCKHPFHFHCIVKWTNAQSGQQKPACPLCRQEWKFATE